jgi:predicted Zn-dependent protease
VSSGATGTRRRRLRSCAAAAALAALACAWLPASGPVDPGAAERESEAVARAVGLIEEGNAADLVRALGSRIAAAAPGVALRFHVVSLPEVNAFSLPGGNVCVSRGLLRFVRSESELANVIAHEVAHVLGQHALRLEERRQQVRFASLAKLAAASLGGSRGVEALELEGAGLVARYSRSLEREADREGQELAKRAGFDPAGMASFLAALDRESTLRLGRPRRPTFLDTHPAAPERATDAAALASALGGAAPPPATARADFLDRLDGLLVGEDPAEGALRDGLFLHPDLDLALRFPPDWRVANGHSAVIAAPAEGPALLVLALQEEHDDPRAAAVRFLRAGRPALELLEQGPLADATVPAHRAWARIAQHGEPLYTRIFWFAHGGRIYRLQGVVGAADLERSAPLFDEAARSFRPLEAEERASFRVRHLRVLAAREGERFEQVLARGANVERLDQIALMNGLDVGARLPAGRRVKVVVEEAYRPGSTSGTRRHASTPAASSSTPIRP